MAASTASSAAAPSESIYHWIKEVVPPPVKAPMYHSKHDPTLQPYIGGSTFRVAAAKKPFGVIGRESMRPDPKAPLRAHEKTGVLAPVAVREYCVFCCCCAAAVAAAG